MSDKKKIKLVVSAGQYEQAASIVTVTYTTERGLNRRIRQLRNEYAVFGDNFAGWIPARIAIASKNDSWGANSIIGGRWCDPANGWIDED
ncbi:hypothetical protein [Alkalispirochaeta alkalica]|uniref:hypothetical protein n=1 Tax=Alkalispirochaeta alkalica TaxID=46356 RepID=UPI000363B58A|nr:hypothetical protein [Alkalispirochaeta alkalica]